MEVVPVLDLMGGLVVHGRQGRREEYRPVESALVETAEPLAVARALSAQLGLDRFYVADLDAIDGRGEHREMVDRLVAAGFRLWLDAGVAGPEEARSWLAAGVERVVVGTETLEGLGRLAELADALGDRLSLSLDWQAGRLLSPAAELRDLTLPELARRAREMGIRHFLLIHLSAVGTGRGLGELPLAEVVQAAGGAPVYVGGGVEGPADLRSLARQGARGALVATALHTGRLTAADLVALAAADQAGQGRAQQSTAGQP